ncbi:TonB-dependent siderophore receptor [Psittacicella gerlachiana]|nr:TonB-dependent receptor [Psittacicella gerlachiana]
MKLTKLALVVCTSALTLNFAIAEETNNNLTLKPVTVVGTVNRLGKADNSASTLNVSVNELEKQTGGTKLDETLLYYPGIYANYAPSNHYNIIRIRGFTPEFAMDGASFSYPSGLYVYNPVLFGLEKVEIVKGANSVLYGATQAGGVVNLISKRPTTTPQGLLQFRIGSHDTYAVGADYSNRINDYVRYRVVGEWQHTRGQKKYTNTNQYYFAPSFTIDFSDNTQLTVLTSFNKQKGVPSNFVVPGYGSFYTAGGSFSRSTYFGEPNFAEVNTKQYSLGWEFTHKFNDNVKYEQNYRYNFIDTDYFDVVAGMATITMTGSTTGTRSYVYNKGKYESHYFDNRLVLNGDLSPEVNAVLALGVELQRVHVSGNYASGSASSIDLFNPTYLASDSTAFSSMSPYHYIQTANQTSLYALSSFDFTKYVTFNYGLRYMSVNGKSEANGISNSYNTGHTVHSAGFTFNLPYEVTPYVNFSQAFRARAPIPTSSTDYRSFAYNKANSLQTGIKYDPELFDGNFEVSYFNIHEHNPFSRNDSTGDYQQTDLAIKTHGWEIAANLDVTDWWQTRLGYTYTSATTYRSTTTFETNGIPKHVVSLWNNFTLSPSVSFGVGARYLSSTNARSLGYLYMPNVMQRLSPYVSLSNMRTKPVWLVDAMVSWQATKDWNVTLNATNLFDKVYFTNCNSVCYFGAGRYVGVTAQYRF